ncbi:synaptonemal complex protein 1-like [Cynara cardunculus var. scolymus]|uniref:synaptonemal complex protein 1-like n=1 Tax=Cynara cardunculus var. scolymus TaxID=59895 RepID=UPI000D62E799|nr:synaptonemal complex protein 1-like [Cynara cardunculus var. scolymus]
MSKLVGLSGIKSLDQFKSSLGSSSLGAAKTFQISSRQPSYSNSSGSFANLKLTAEKLVKEQASAKTDLDLANSKLKKLSEHILTLEEKLQNAYNENAKLKVKHKEDEKLWRGLESKFSSTKTLCDQLTKTLHLLADQVQDAEKDKVLFTNKLSETSVALDNLHGQLNSLSLRLESSQETIRTRDKELKELGVDKENVEKKLRDEHCKVVSLTDEKDNLIKNFEETVTANESTIESLNSKVRELQLELRSKEGRLNDMHDLNEKKERENTDLIASNKNLAENLDKAMQEIESLENFVKLLTVKLTDLDRQSLTFWEKVIEVEALFASCFELVQEENKFATQKAQQHFDRLNNKFLIRTSEKDALQLVNLELKNKISELENDQKFTMAQHAEECHLAEEKVRRLESEAETLLSKKAETDNLITKLEDKIRSLSETSRLSEIQMQDFQKKYSQSETENQESIRNLQSEIHKKEEDIDALKMEIVKHEQHVDSVEKQLNELHSLLQEKEQVVLEFKEREKLLEDQRAETQKLLVEAEGNVADAKKQYDQMLESKQLELSRHLKEISQKNDQAINDIRRKYEVEKQECLNLEKEKAEKAVIDMEKKCDKKLSECKEESKQQLMQIEREHTALVNRIRENDKTEENLKSNHCEELKRVQLQAENEFREKTKLLKNQHEAELRELRSQHEEECRHLEEELNIQKNREERQRALLQLQWKVMGDEPQEDQEVTSKKDSPYINVTQSPVSNMLKKAEKTKTGSVISIPKHSKKVTHHEYEVETSHGRTITKRRKTKSTIMFQDPTKNKRRTPKANTPRDVIKRIKGGNQQNPPNIGDLFSEGSLNPYADDPYAFD